MRISNTKAFTLVEILVTTLLAVTIAVTSFTALMLGINYLRQIMELRTATLILQEQASIVRDLEYSEITSLGGTFSSSAMSSLDDAAGTISKSFYKPDNKILKITFKLDWTSYTGNPAEKTLATLVTDHGINKK